MDAVIVPRGVCTEADGALIARSFEVVQAWPVGWQVDRLEDVDGDGGAVGVEGQRRIADAGAPAGVDERSMDVALEPAAGKPVELMVVRPTRGQAAVGRQAVESGIPSSSPPGLSVTAHVLDLITECRQPHPTVVRARMHRWSCAATVAGLSAPDRHARVAGSPEGHYPSWSRRRVR